MADSKKYAERKKLISPVGTFVYPKLNEPDTKFKAEGEYSLKLRVSVDDPAAQALVKVADHGAAESLKAAKDRMQTKKDRDKWTTKYLPYEVEEDDDGKETGFYLFKFSMAASGVSKKTGKPWKRRPLVLDAKAHPINVAKTQIWGGTTGKVSFVVIPYSPTAQVGASVKFGLEGVKILDLVSSGGQRSASDLGLDGEEEGFEYEEPEDEVDDEDVADAADDDADEDGDEDDF